MNAGRWPFNEERAGRGHITHQGMAGVILHPLTEVGLGMFVAVVVGRRQRVMDLQGRGEWRHREQHASKEQGNRPSVFELCVTMAH